MSPYVYVGNNPVNLIDPMGLTAQIATPGNHSTYPSETMTDWYQTTCGAAGDQCVQLAIPIAPPLAGQTTRPGSQSLNSGSGSPESMLLNGGADRSGVSGGGMDPCSAFGVGCSSEKGNNIQPRESTSSANNYRETFFRANPEAPRELEVHHSLPQKYDSILNSANVNIHESQYLRGVTPETHREITNAWRIWDRSLGRMPTVNEIEGFAARIDQTFGQSMFPPR